MSGQTRRRLDMGTWREVLRRFEASSSTVGDFCASEGVCASSFYRWRARLGSADQKAHGELTRGGRRQGMTPNCIGFIDLGDLAGTTPKSTPGGLELRLDLGAGVVLHLLRR